MHGILSKFDSILRCPWMRKHWPRFAHEIGCFTLEVAISFRVIVTEAMGNKIFLRGDGNLVFFSLHQSPYIGRSKFNLLHAVFFEVS